MGNLICCIFHTNRRRAKETLSLSILLSIILSSTVLVNGQRTPASPISRAQLNAGKIALKMGPEAYEIVRSVVATKQSELVLKQDPNNLANQIRLVGNMYRRRKAAGDFAITSLDNSSRYIILKSSLIAAVPTSGWSLVVGLGAWVAKNKAISSLREKAGEKTLNYLEDSLGKFFEDEGITAKNLKDNWDSKKIDKYINKTKAVRDFKNKLPDKESKEIFEAAVVDRLSRLSKSNFEKIKKNRQNIIDNRKDIKANRERIDKLEKDLKVVTNDLKTFKEEVAKNFEEDRERITALETNVDALTKRTSKNKKEISKLTKKYESNTKLLRATAGVLYGKATPSEKLTLLEAGFLRDEMCPDLKDKPKAKCKEHEVLKESVKIEKDRAKISSEIRYVVGKFNQIATIVDNLGLDKDGDIGKLVNITNAGTEVALSLLNVPPDYLGAIVALTGLFKKRGPSPHQQMMNFLADNFRRINEKLDKLIEGQRKIMTALNELNKTIADNHDEVIYRFRRLENRLDILDGAIFDLMFDDFSRCGTTMKQLRGSDGIKKERKKDDQFNYLQLLKIGQPKFFGVTDCTKFLKDIFNKVYDPDDLGLDPLSLKYARKVPNSIDRTSLEKVYNANGLLPDKSSCLKDKNGQIDKKTCKPLANQTNGEPLSIKEAIGLYARKIYSKNAKFIISLEKNAKENGFRPGGILVALQSPSGSIGEFENKWKYVISKPTDSDEYCTKDTIMSDPLVRLFCQPQSNGDDKGPPKASLDDMSIFPSTEVKKRIGNILSSPLMLDTTLKLSEWAIFYSTVADVMIEENKPYSSFRELLKNESFETDGDSLIAGAHKLNTIAVIQRNLMHGDVTARLMFDYLWKKCEKNNQPCIERFYSEQELEQLGGKHLEAFNVFQVADDYLRSNVLMFGLDAARKRVEPNKDTRSTGESIAYSSAIRWMEASSSSKPNVLLKNLFTEREIENTEIPFKVNAENKKEIAVDNETIDDSFIGSQLVITGQSPVHVLSIGAKDSYDSGLRKVELNESLDITGSQRGLLKQTPWEFVNIGVPIISKGSLEERKKKLKDCQEKASKWEKSEKCFWIPAVKFLSVTHPLPDVLVFSRRDFVYPPALIRQLNMNERLNSELTDYEVMDWISRSFGNDEAKRRDIFNLLIFGIQ